jgi:hypothetical protein
MSSQRVGEGGALIYSEWAGLEALGGTEAQRGRALEVAERGARKKAQPQL